MRGRTPLWVYGTLRPGCGNDRTLGDYEHIGTATMPGRLAFHACGQYPVWIYADGFGYPDDTGVVGDVLLADSGRVAEVAAMELLAGYDAQWETIDLGEYREVEALTFPWRRRAYRELLIPSGDWYDVAFRTQDERRRMRAYATVIREENA